MSTKMATGETSACQLIPAATLTIARRSKRGVGGIEFGIGAETPGEPAQASDRILTVADEAIASQISPARRKRANSCQVLDTSLKELTAMDKKQLTYNEYMEKLTPEERKRFSSLNEKVVAGGKSVLALGESMAAIHDLFAGNKDCKAGGFKAYCAESDIVRTTALNWIAEYRGAKVVPQDYKALARNGKLDPTVRSLIIRSFLTKRTLEHTASEVQNYLAANPKTDDPIKAAVEKAAKLLVAACKGQLDKVADLVQYEETFSIAQSTMDGTATNIMAASQFIAQKAFEDIRELANKREDLKGLKLPEQVMITNPNAGRKQLPTA
jgi:hypothetical protein